MKASPKMICSTEAAGLFTPTARLNMKVPGKTDYGTVTARATGRTAPSAMKAGSQKAFPTADTSYCHNGNKTYDGYWSAGKKNGYGRLYDKEGDIIENVLIGRGTCYFPENDEYGRISYTGSFANGMFDGHGTMNRKEGAVYKGSRKDGVRDCRIYNIGDNLSNQTTYRAISILT